MKALEARQAASTLVAKSRWGALATTCDDGTPLASQVAVAPAHGGVLLMHLSQLAEHTRNLTQRPAVSVVMGQPDIGDPDPQTLARISILGMATLLAPGAAGYEAAKAAYLSALPAAESRFVFTDFGLYALAPTREQYVGGFARAFRFNAQDSRQLLGEAVAPA